MFSRALSIALAGVAACAAPQQAREGGEPVVAAEHTAEPEGSEPGAARGSRACVSLGLSKDGAQPDGSVARDVGGGEKEFARGASLFSAGDYGAALEAYTKATEADPFHALAFLGKAESHLYTDNDQTAMRSSLAQVLKLAPTNPRAHLRAGELALETGEAQRAEAHFRCALELRPDYADVRRTLARYLLAHDRAQEAEAVIEPAVTAQPEDVEALMLLADVLEAEQRFIDAAKRVEEAAAKVKTSAPLWRRAASLYERSGNFVAEKKAREEADKLDPPEKERDLRPLPKAKTAPKGG